MAKPHAGLMFKRTCAGGKVFLIAIMEEEACKGLLDEHQHVVTMQRDVDGITTMHIMENHHIDRTKEAYGMGISGIATSCWWRN